MAVPRVEKVVVNMGLGEATSNAKLVDVGADELARITGQKPVTRRAKKSIAAFKVRKDADRDDGDAQGPTDVEFLDRLMTIALPRVRDFKGVSRRALMVVATTRSASGISCSFRDRLHESGQGSRDERLSGDNGEN